MAATTWGAPVTRPERCSLVWRAERGDRRGGLRQPRDDGRLSTDHQESEKGHAWARPAKAKNRASCRAAACPAASSSSTRSVARICRVER